MIHRHRQQCGDSQRERGWGEVEVGKEGIHGDRKGRLSVISLGDESMMQCADDLLLSSTCETCTVLLTNVSPIHSI